MNPDNIIRSRIGNACDSCKARKVKCDGKLPCSYCARRQRSHACHYSPQRRRTRQQRQQPPRSPRSASDGDTRSRRSGSALNPNLSSGLNHHETHNVHASSSSALSHTTSHSLSSNHNTNLSSGINSNTNHQPNHTLNPRDNTIQNAPASTPAMRPTSSGVDATHEDDTEVPREARLLCDAQGKLIFIGDCAPLSFFQSVRQLVTTKIGQNAFAPHSSRYSVLENAPARASHRLPGDNRVPNVTSLDVPSVVSSYLVTTVGLIDLYDGRLVEDLMMWTNSSQRPDDATSIANFLILAIGCHVKDEDMAQDCFEYARDRAFVNLSGNLSVDTVQVFLLITVYMLCSCQINGAFLFFGISVRAAYSIGIHRTEVNARFGHDIRRQRDRLWKSLRIVDLFLSTSMGRPPATSDVDCTVPYEEKDENGNEVFDLLNSSVQIFLILEMVVVEIYSRKKISLRLTEGISLQLRDWSIRWLRKLKDVIASPVEAQDRAQVAGACQILSTYYYAVMLVSRPFLMYELCRRLSDPALSSSNSRSTSLPSGKSKLADACIDAASLMVDPISDLVGRGVLTGRCPLLVTWLFASSLVLGVGLLGGFGRILEKYTRASIQTLDYFSKHDTHATQYSLIAQSLLTAAVEYLEKRELQERLLRTESSSQLFGLIPRDNIPGESTPMSSRDANAITSSPMGVSSTRMRESLDRSFLQHNGLSNMGSPPRFGDLDAAFLGLNESLLQTPDSNHWNGTFGGDDPGSTLNLFALLDAGGGIDLAHHL